MGETIRQVVANRQPEVAMAGPEVVRATQTAPMVVE
jgi:hypothetical protein